MLVKTLSLVCTLYPLTLSCDVYEQFFPKQAHTLHLSIERPPCSLDPRKGDAISTSLLHFLLFDGLTRVNTEGKIALSIARDVDISEDCCTYTFHLNECFWSDNTPIQANDFVESWKTILRPDFPALNASLLYPIKNAYQYKLGNAKEKDLGIAALDNKTLQVTLHSKTPHFLELLSFSTFFPIPKKIDVTRHKKPTVFSGPFTLEEFTPYYIVLKKNPLYHKAAQVSVQKIVFFLVEDSLVALDMFQKNQLDMVGPPLNSLPYAALPFLKKNPQLHLQPIPATTLCVCNTKHPLLQNDNIRQALACATDQKKLVQQIMLLQELPAYSLVPPQMYQTPLPPPSEKKKNKALELLQRGLQDMHLSKEELPPITYHYPAGEMNSMIAEILQQQWEESLGISVQLVKCERHIFMSHLQEKTYMCAQVFVAAQYPHPINFLERFEQASYKKNHSGWENSQYQEKLALFRESTTPKEQEIHLQEAEALLIAQAPIIPLFHWCSATMVQHSIHNFNIAPLGIGLFEAITIDPPLPQNIPDSFYTRFTRFVEARWGWLFNSAKESSSTKENKNSSAKIAHNESKKD